MQKESLGLNNQNIRPLWDKRDAAHYTPEQCRAVPWFNVDGDHSLRINYPLNSGSIAYDVGGYAGDWAEEIYDKYHCSIEIFEPVQDFANAISKKFADKKKVRVHAFGLADKNQRASITLEGPSSSTHKKSKASSPIELKRAGDFINAHHKKIDLIKINIEGDEYELLEHLIKSGDIKKIVDIQLQFHKFVPNAQERSVSLRNKLSKTHYLTYYYPWIWENWRLKK